MRLFVGTVLFMLLASPLHAQKGNPAFTEPETRQAAPGTPAPHETNPQDQLFAKLAAMSGLAEVQLAELATGKSQNGEVKDFAALMIDDHGKANRDLAELAKAAQIRLPDVPSPEHKAVYTQLKGLDGGAFDVAYMRNQLQEHQKSSHPARMGDQRGARRCPTAVRVADTAGGLAPSRDGAEGEGLAHADGKP